MANKQPIHTASAPGAIGTYSQAIRAGNTIYLSGQIPLDPATMKLVEGGIREQIVRVFDNLAAVAAAADASLDDAVTCSSSATPVTVMRSRAPTSSGCSSGQPKKQLRW